MQSHKIAVQSRLRLKCDCTHAEIRFCLSVKWMRPFKSVGASIQSTTGSQDTHISGSNAGYTMFQTSVKSTGYLLQSPVCPSLALPCVPECHHISTGLYYILSLSLSFILLHLQHNFGTWIHIPILFHMKWSNTVTYRIVDTADSKKKVKEDFVFLPFQFTI